MLRGAVERLTRGSALDNVENAAGELELLDAPNGIAAVRQRLGSRFVLTSAIGSLSFYEARVVNEDAAVGVGAEGVVGDDIGIDGRVDVASFVAIDDLTDNVELTRIERPAEHQGVEPLAVVKRDSSSPNLAIHIILRRVNLSAHPVGCSNYRTGAVLVRVNGDADIEPFVAVDHIVAGETLDHVASSATEQDIGSVCGLENHRFDDAVPTGLIGAGDVSHQSAQPGNQIDVRLQKCVGVCVQRRAIVGNSSRAFGFSAGVHRDAPTGQRVILVPAREPFDEVEAIAQDEGLLGLEDRNAQVGIGGLAVALVDAPVEASHTIRALDALAILGHDVVAGLTIVVRVATASEQDVVSDDRGVEEQLGVLAG
ncbi:hypothetical protein AEGHOMDF_2109 [Methylobacterium soli]|nr:hypothetical protein AEGHOMDF_2109 [Methylobacterium soli]